MSPLVGTDTLRSILAEARGHSGSAWFDIVTAAMFGHLGFDCSLIGVYDPLTRTITTRSLSVDGEIQPNIRYDLRGTPCERVASREPCAFWSDLQNLFPEDLMLQDMGAESYVGSPLLGADQSVLGLVAGLRREPMLENEELCALMALLSDRVAVELERERALQELSRTRLSALDAERSRHRMVFNLSHELRTPLHGLLGTLSIFQEAVQDPIHKDLLAQVRSSGQALVNVFDEVLELSRIEAGELTLSLSPFALETWANEVASAYRIAATERGLELIVEVEPRSDPITSDAICLRQVSAHFLSNAIKYTEKGQVIFRCAVFGQGQNARLRCEVQDSGRGIPQAQRASIFDCLERYSTAGHKVSSGLGLGLAISRRIIERLDGRIGVKEGPQGGALFWFEVPVAELDPALGTPQIRSGDAICEDGPNRVLVVEDNPVNRRIAKSMLDRLGLAHVFAVDGQQALDFAQDSSIGLILMDCLMPVMDGYEATRRLRERGDRRPILALTANTTPEDRERCRRVGMNAFLAKPLSLDELRQALCAWLPSKRLAP